MDFETLFRKYTPREQFVLIREQLMIDRKSQVPSVETFMIFIANMHQFQRRPQHDKLTRIPTRLFLDLEPRGSVFYMLKTSLAQLGPTMTAEWQWNNFSARQECNRLLVTVTEILKYAGLYKIPTILVEDGPSKLRLQMTAQQLGATVVDSLNNQVTHILTQQSFTSRQPRYVGLMGDCCQKHTGGKPDSQDLWVPAKQEVLVYQHQQPFTVSQNWLTDSRLFNEWMNEYDYMKGFKQEEDYSEPASPTMQEDEEAIQAAQVSTWPLVTLVNLDRRLPVKFKRADYEPVPNGTIINISPAAFVDPIPYNILFGKVRKPKLPEPVIQLKSDEIHDYERMAFSDYWEQEQQERMYLMMRNTFLKMYQQDPYLYLTVGKMKYLYEDQETVYLNRIHQILTFTKNINSLPHIAPPQPCSISQMDRLRHITPKNVDESVYHFTDRSLKPFQCYMCAHMALSMYYRLVDDHDLVLCQECFIIGRFPSEFTSKDFKCCIGLPQAEHGRDWTDEETLKLLDLIETHRDNWTQIGQDMDIDPEECKAHFVTLTSPKLSTIDFVKQFVAQAQNPVLFLVDLLSAAVNPAVGSMLAQYALQYMSTHPITDMQKMTLEAAIKGLDHTIEQAKTLAETETKQIESLAQQLISTQMARIRVKLTRLQDAINQTTTPEFEKNRVTRMFQAAMQQ